MLLPSSLRTRSITVRSDWLFSAMMAAMAAWSAAVWALTKRAAAAEISPDVTDNRMASVIIGTWRLATCSKPRSVAENDTMATTAAITVMAATAPKASCSLALMPKLVPKRRRLPSPGLPNPIPLIFIGASPDAQ